MSVSAIQKIAYNEFSVSEISHKIKDLLQENLGTVRIKGEISGLKFASSGHIYFNLKDNAAVLSCICWKGIRTNLTINLNLESDGLEVIGTGKITSYEGQSKYQLIITNISPAGIGAMMQILNERKEKLAKEGLFDISSKKPIPLVPQLIGIITSLEGAVIRDIIHRIKDRYPTNVVIWPAAVQGIYATEQIVNGIIEFNKLVGNKRPDVLIIARGGGSVDDLWTFNDERIVRTVFASQIPIIAAIGHANDYTLINDVADIAAPTPTAAAEIATPVKIHLAEKILLLHHKMIRAVKELIKFNKHTLWHNNKILQRSRYFTENYQQKIDDLTFRLTECLPNLLKNNIKNLAVYHFNRLAPYKNIELKKLQLSGQVKELNNKIQKVLTNTNNRLVLRSTLLQSLDYKNVLKRGFTIITNDQQQYITSSEEANHSIQQELNIKFYDGSIKVKKI